MTLTPPAGRPPVSLAGPQHRSSILFVTHESSRTGAPIFLLRFLRWFKQHNPAPFRILAASEGALFHEFASLAPTDSFEPAQSFLYRAQRKLGINGMSVRAHQATLRERLAHSDIGLVYSNTIVNGEILDFLSFLQCPVITHVHELERVIRFFGERNESLVKRYTSRFIAVSSAVANNLVKAHGIPPEGVRVVHGFIPVSSQPLVSVPEARASVRSEIGVSPETPLVCGCGSIELRKGIEQFLDVAKIVVGTNPEAHFFWVGGGPAQIQEVAGKAAARGLENRVHFLGAKPDVATYYAASDVFFLSSLEDPFPLVVMEAALQGVPVVCFRDSGGAPEFVEPDAGLVAPGFDLNAMASHISSLLRSPELSRKLGASGQKKVMDQFGLDAGAAKIDQIIRESLSHV
jgi:glycosyltransferase involved in cell wall biosynthesis